MEFIKTFLDNALDALKNFLLLSTSENMVYVHDGFFVFSRPIPRENIDEIIGFWNQIKSRTLPVRGDIIFLGVPGKFNFKTQGYPPKCSVYVVITFKMDEFKMLDTWQNVEGKEVHISSSVRNRISFESRLDVRNLMALFIMHMHLRAMESIPYTGIVEGEYNAKKVFVMPKFYNKFGILSLIRDNFDKFRKLVLQVFGFKVD